MKRLTIAGVILLLSAGAAAAGTLTFREAVAIAMERNPLIAVARNSAEIAGNNAHIGGAGLLPSVDLTGSANYVDTDPASGPETQITMNSADVTAAWTLFDGFGNIYRYKRLTSAERQGALDARDTIEGILVQVASAYYGAAAAQENLRIAERLLEISRERVERARKRADFGQAGLVNVLAAEVDFNSDTVTVVQAAFARDEAIRRLNVLLARDPGTDVEIDTAVEFAGPADYETLRAEAARRNAAYRSSVEALEQARLGVGIARAAWLPRLDLSASYGYDRTAPDFDITLDDHDRGWNVRAAVSINLFDGFRKRVDSKNASIQARTGELLERQARLELDEALASAYESYRNSRTVLDIETRNLDAARVNFTQTRRLYELGQVTSTQFREAQLNLIRAETNVSTARYDARLEEIDLDRLAGRLVAVDDTPTD